MISRRDLLRGAAAGTLAAREGAAQIFGKKKKKPEINIPPPPRPNVMLVVLGDVGSWMLGCYGNQELKTPQIDQIARGGSRFTFHFAGSTVASAARGALLSGVRPGKLGITEDVPAPLTGSLLSDLLAAAGYRAAFAGEWNFSGGPGSTGSKHGFSTFDPLEPTESTFGPKWVTARASAFLDQQSPAPGSGGGPAPFFLQVSYPRTRIPYAGYDPKFADLYAGATFDKLGWEPVSKRAKFGRLMFDDIRGNLAKFGAIVSATDAEVGALMAKIDQKGLRENTLVIVTADAGFLLGRHGLWSNGLASEPDNMYDEVTGVPMIWNWPGVVPVQGTRPETVSALDFVPSLCDAVGATPPAGLVGQNYWPWLNARYQAKNIGGSKAPKASTVFAEWQDSVMARDARFKLVVRGARPAEFYDLKMDPGEKINQVGNPAFVSERQRMQQEIAEFRKS
ncbi:MAG: sulfatase-like hydrolase/transferase [Bryobacteraceae bacterium]